MSSEEVVSSSSGDLVVGSSSDDEVVASSSSDNVVVCLYGEDVVDFSRGIVVVLSLVCEEVFLSVSVTIDGLSSCTVAEGETTVVEYGVIGIFSSDGVFLVGITVVPSSRGIVVAVSFDEVGGIPSSDVVGIRCVVRNVVGMSKWPE